MGVIGDAVPGCRFQYLKPRIMAFDENAIHIFALHKCGRILVNLKPGSGCRVFGKGRAQQNQDEVRFGDAG
jgi:hypothetical protein